MYEVMKELLAAKVAVNEAALRLTAAVAAVEASALCDHKFGKDGQCHLCGTHDVAAESQEAVATAETLPGPHAVAINSIAEYFGATEVVADSKRCIKCLGCGKYPTIATPCPVCKGAGTVPVEAVAGVTFVPTETNHSTQLAIAGDEWANEFSNRVRAQAMHTEKESTTCRCGNVKSTLQSFCRTCYWNLPQSVRNGLYAELGKGYEAAYKSAALFFARS